MSVDEHHALVNESVRHRNCLLRIAHVIADDQLQLLAQDATLGIDVGNCEFRAVAHLFPARRIRASHRSCNTNQQIRPDRIAHPKNQSGRANASR
jgi:hypothetical protein